MNIFKISSGNTVGVLCALACSLLLVDQTTATDVREKLIVKAYNCSDFATHTTITRPLLSSELPSQRGTSRFGPSGHGCFGGFVPTVGERVAKQNSSGTREGLFGISSKQGLSGGSGLGAGALDHPKPQAKDRSEPPSTITYQKKDLTEITNLIYESVDPKSWRGGNASTKIHQVGSILVIKQTQENHDKIQKLLHLLNEAQKQ